MCSLGRGPSWGGADRLLVLQTVAGCHSFGGPPCADDVLLSYQSTSYHDAASIRELFGLRSAPEMQRWIEEHGVIRDGLLLPTEDAPRRHLLGRLEGRFEARS